MRLSGPVLVTLVAFLVDATTACDKGKEIEIRPEAESIPQAVADCPTLSVTADGEPIDGLSFGLGYQEPSGAYLVSVFNHDDVSCEELIAGVRTVPPGEVAAHVWTDGYQATVSLGASETFTDDVQIVETPTEVDDTIAVCIPEPVELQGHGSYRDRAIRVRGLFSGRFCGRQGE